MTTRTITRQDNTWIASIDTVIIGSYSTIQEALKVLQRPYITTIQLGHDNETNTFQWGAFCNEVFLGYYPKYRSAQDALDDYFSFLLTNPPRPIESITITVSVDHDRLHTVYTDVLPTVADKPFWRVALRKAYDYLSKRETVTYDDHGNMLIESTTHPDTVYHVNGTCECPGNKYHRHCWHRVAYRLLMIAAE